MCQESCTAQTRDRGSAEGGKHRLTKSARFFTSRLDRTVSTDISEPDIPMLKIAPPTCARAADGVRLSLFVLSQAYGGARGGCGTSAEQLVMLQPCTAIVPRKL